MAMTPELNPSRAIQATAFSNSKPIDTVLQTLNGEAARTDEIGLNLNVIADVSGESIS